MATSTSNTSCHRLTYSTQTHTKFDYDGSSLMTEYDDAGNIIRRYIPGPGVDETLVRSEGSGNNDKRWLATDECGSVAQITKASGATLAINSYDKYGISALGTARTFRSDLAAIGIERIELHEDRMIICSWARDDERLRPLSR